MGALVEIIQLQRLLSLWESGLYVVAMCAVIKLLFSVLLLFKKFAFSFCSVELDGR